MNDLLGQHAKYCVCGITNAMGNTNVLLADDHEVVRAGIRNVIEDTPNLTIVGEVEDGPSLLEKLEDTSPDLLLLDISMPSFDPLKTIPKIKQQYPDLKILVVSAYDDNQYVQGLLKNGIDGYHLKDQPLSDLKLALQRILDGKRWISASLITNLVEHFETQEKPPMLSKRQLEILRLLKDGSSNQEIATTMDISIKTVENHLTRIYRLLGVKSRLEAGTYIAEHPEVLGVKGHTTFKNGPISARSPNALSILFVDDNRQYLHQLQRVLGRIVPQANLFEANDIDEAVNISKNIQPQLALVDVVLGDEDGINCARRIKAISKNTRVIMISAYPDREFHRLSIEAGAVAFLDKKDLDARTLRQVVKDI